jgi:hypothetical protein
MGRPSSWFSLAIDSWSLGLEASTVVGLRLLRLSEGGAAAAAEAERMVREKLDAAADLGALALTGRLGTSCESAASGTLKHYRRKVKANRRRLGGKRRR